MNTIKFQQELIKYAAKGLPSIYFKENNFILIAHHSCKFAMRIKREDLYINLSKFYTATTNFLDFDKEEKATAFTIGEMQAWGKDTYIKFIYGKENKIFINQKYLSYFKSLNLTYKATKKILYIYDCEELIGAICTEKLPKEN